MLLNPVLDNARPLMVVGLPRCGTRFIANAFNKHPAVHLNGEIPHVTMKAAIEFVTATDEFFTSRDRVLTNRDNAYVTIESGWTTQRRELLYTMWASLPKSVPVALPDHSVGWYGHKTPNHDQFWEFYRDFFGGSGPKYVFCMRGFADNYISRDAIGAKPIAQVAKQYRAAVNRYADMKEALGDDVSLFILEDLREGGVDYLREVLFDRLSIPVSADVLTVIDPHTPANSSAQKGIEKRSLNDAERAFIAKNRDLVEALDAARSAQRI
ncbi:unannotated protein [freshwater metagenome]|uniref:Unannotated protein n=1 Tax=freshwater metagenome TaxID=449393 RepID=A0A6J7GLT2_9ZZZZ|nr:hypothetical protein [Actinomycetota bacterium]